MAKVERRRTASVARLFGMVSSGFNVLLDKSRKGKRFHQSTGERALF
jgi:hypothetical protein